MSDQFIVVLMVVLNNTVERKRDFRSVHCGLMVVLNNTVERKRDLMSDQFIVV